MNEMLKAVADASGWTITEQQMQEIAMIYKGTMEDTRPVRELDLGSAAPAIFYKADQ